MHEDLSRKQEAPPPTDRKFGLIIGGVVVVLGLLPLLKGGNPRAWLIVLGALLILLGQFYPSALGPLNRAWMWLGRILHKVMSPLICGILFFAVVTPLGLLMRLMGKDPLSRARSPKLDSYWIRRTVTEFDSATMKNQF